MAGRKRPEHAEWQRRERPANAGSGPRIAGQTPAFARGSSRQLPRRPARREVGGSRAGGQHVVAAQVARRASDRERRRTRARRSSTGLEADGRERMDAAGRSAASAHRTSPVRRLLGPRPAFMAIAAVCVVAVVAVLAQLVVSSEHASRTSAEQRFATGAGVRAQLTASLLSPPRARRCARPRASCPRHRTGCGGSQRRHISATPPSSRGMARCSPSRAGLRPRSPAASPRVPATCARRSRVARGCPISSRPAPHGASTLDWAIPFRSRRAGACSSRAFPPPRSRPS